MSNSACQSVSAKRKSTSVVLISLEFFSLLPTFDIFSVLDGRVQALFDIDFELQNVPPANVPSNPVQSVQSMPVQFNSLMEANNRNVMPAVSNYNCTVHFKFFSK
jgi:hypothetical protein